MVAWLQESPSASPAASIVPSFGFLDITLSLSVVEPTILARPPMLMVRTIQVGREGSLGQRLQPSGEFLKLGQKRGVVTVCRRIGRDHRLQVTADPQCAPTTENLITAKRWMRCQSFR